jgi:hypothetical protein
VVTDAVASGRTKIGLLSEGATLMSIRTFLQLSDHSELGQA